jgi:hypothetical protein
MTCQKREKKGMLTFFTDQTVVPVVGIVCVTKTTMRELELEEFVAMLARMPSAARKFMSVAIFTS